MPQFDLPSHRRGLRLCLDALYEFTTKGGRDVPNAHNIEEDCEGSMFAELAG